MMIKDILEHITRYTSSNMSRVKERFLCGCKILNNKDV